MTYGTIKVDTVTFTDAGIDKSVTLSGLVQNPTFSGNVTVTGTLSGVTVTGTTANFTSGNFTNISGGTHTITSGVFAAGSAASPSITFTGDLNTGIYSPGADQVAISTSGSGRAVIGATGRLGLGTMSPGVKVDILAEDNTSLNPVLRVNSNNVAVSTALAYDGLICSNQLTIGNTSSNPIIFNTNSSERLRITSAGLVGVGTSSPSSKLDVRDASVSQITSSVNGVQTAVLGSDTSTGAYTGTLDNYPYKFLVNGSVKATLTSTGLGIGTTSPGGKLVISDGTTTFQFDPVGGTGNILRSLTSGGSRDSLLFDASQYVYSNGATEYARIDSSGRLGIGTSSPGTLVEGRITGGGGTPATSGTSQPNAVFRVSGSGTTGVLDIGCNSGAPWIQSTDRTDLSQKYSLLLNPNGGSVGIGTASPSGLLNLSASNAAGYVSQILDNTNATGYVNQVFRIGSAGASGQAEINYAPGTFFAIGPVANDTTTPIVFRNNNATERARIDSSGRLLVGTSSARTNVFADLTTALTPAHQIETVVNSSWSTGLSIINNSSSGFAPVLTLGLSCANSVGSNTLVPNANTLGRINFAGNDGTNFVCGARIAGETDGTTGSGDLPSRLVFSTTADGASSPTERLRITSAGLVGIGTSSPNKPLHIYSGSSDSEIRLQSNSGTEQNAYITLRNSGGKLDLYSVNGDIALNPGNNVAATFKADGKVGIGTATPDALLTAVASSATNGVVANFANSTTGALLQFSQTGIANWRVGSPAGQDALAFYRYGSGAYPEAARIDSSGRLLVGTSSARTNIFNTVAAKLFQVESDGGTAGASLIRSSADGGSPDLVFGKSRSASIGGNTIVQSGDAIGSISFQGNDGSEFVAAASITAEVDGTPGANDMPGRLVFSTTADGEGSPTERLRIDSRGYLTALGVYNNTTAAAANVHVSSAGGELFRSTSSIKYKTDVETIQDSYSEALLNCRPVWYRSTCEGDNANWGWWGFIAEEVAEIDPRLVHWKTTEVTYDEKGAAIQTPCDPEPESVQYDRFVPHLLNLVKRQQQAIETLEAKVAALESA